jgi:hypothetical protein
MAKEQFLYPKTQPLFKTVGGTQPPFRRQPRASLEDWLTAMSAFVLTTSRSLLGTWPYEQPELRT